PAAGRLDRDTQLSELNGGNGIQRGHIRITDSTNATADIDLSRAGTVGEVLQAINSATGIHVTASVSGDHLVIHDAANGSVTVADARSATTAESLGIAGSGTGGTLTGAAVYRIQGTTSLQSLNDGNGIRISDAAGTDTHDFRIVDRTGATHTIDI